jgi:hypothetical protein
MSQRWSGWQPASAPRKVNSGFLSSISNSFPEDLIAIRISNAPALEYALHLDHSCNGVAGGPEPWATMQDGVSLIVRWRWKAAPATAPPTDKGAR